MASGGKLRTRTLSLITALTLVAWMLVYLAPSAGAITLGAVAVATNLNDPTAFTFTSDGRIFYAERSSGQIRILDPGTGSNNLYFTIPKVVAGDGIVGLTLHPRFPTKAFVYAYGSRMIRGIERDQLIRISGSNTVGSTMKVLKSFDAGTVPPAHHGGRLLFGPDARLYLMVGDAGSPSAAQDLAVPYGKVLRLTAAGGTPPDDPFPNTAVYAYGLRNSIGMAFDPVTGGLWETDNGPECNDEVNTVQASGNYGWGPSATCSTPPPAPANTSQDGPDPILPASWFDVPVAPTGLVFCASCRLGSSLQSHLLVGDYLDRQILDLTLDATRTAVVARAVVYTHTAGIRSVERSASGSIYFSDVTGIFRLTR